MLEHNQNITQVAKEAGIKRTEVYKRLRALGILIERRHKPRVGNWQGL